MLFKRRTPQDPTDLVPWYVNQTLPDAERAVVEDWLQAQPDRAEQLTIASEVRTAVSAQPRLAPSPLVRQQLLARVNSRQPASRRMTRSAWLVGSAVTLVLLVALWAVIQPGIALQWSVAGSGASAYRVYRALTDSEEFDLLSEIPAHDNAQAYSFTDTTLLPSETYKYVVEAVTVTGQTTLSPLAVGRGLDVLPAQLALIFTSLVAGVAVMFLVGTPARSTTPRRFVGA